jgi:hypothetical protein
MFSFCSHGVKRLKTSFSAPWRVDQGNDCFRVFDANGVALAVVFCRDDLNGWSFSHGHLTSDEARRIANAIARPREVLMQRRGFCPRGPRHGHATNRRLSPPTAPNGRSLGLVVAFRLLVLIVVRDDHGLENAYSVGAG